MAIPTDSDYVKAPVDMLLPGVTEGVIERMFPTPNPYIRNPIGWVRNKAEEFMWSKQRQIARAVVNNRYTAVRSCHDSGKSYTASRLAAWWIDVHPPGSAFVITTAPTSHQVEAILWREIGRIHRKAQLIGRITLDCKWRLGPAHGEELVAYGRKPADYNPEAFQGLHQQYVLVIIDEANGVPKVLFDAIDTLVTNVHARVLAIGNPDSPTSHFASLFREGSGWRNIWIDGFKTPNFTGEPVPEYLYDLLLSAEWVQEREKRWGMGSPLWEAKVRGRFPRTADGALVSVDWWESACRRQLPALEDYTGQFGLDVARFGQDYSMLYRNQQGILRRENKWAQCDTMESANRAVKYLALYPGSPMLVDETGVGAGVLDRLNELGLFVFGFAPGGQASSTQFKNLRSESFWHLREMFEYGLLDVDPEDDELQSQLTSILWKVDDKGRIAIESKDEYMRRLHTHSPDAADAAAMACWEAPVYESELLNHAAEPAITSDLMSAVW